MCFTWCLLRAQTIPAVRYESSADVWLLILSVLFKEGSGVYCCVPFSDHKSFELGHALRELSLIHFLFCFLILLPLLVRMTNDHLCILVCKIVIRCRRSSCSQCLFSCILQHAFLLDSRLNPWKNACCKRWKMHPCQNERISITL